jgi:hypothetical protein
MALALLATACTATVRTVHLPPTAADIQAVNSRVSGREARIDLRDPKADRWAASDSFHGLRLRLNAQAIEWDDARTGAQKGAPATTLTNISWLSDGHPRAFGALQGAALGLIGGATAGALIGFASTSPGDFFSPGVAAKIGAVLFALPGLAVGAAIGAAVGHHDAIEFTPPR